MLESFKAQGFTHIGFEALLPGQTQPEEGFYTQEPVFAALLMRAHELGFEVFGYELNEQVPEGESNFDFREEAQAKILQRLSTPQTLMLAFSYLLGGAILPSSR